MSELRFGRCRQLPAAAAVTKAYAAFSSQDAVRRSRSASQPSLTICWSYSPRRHAAVTLQLIRRYQFMIEGPHKLTRVVCMRRWRHRWTGSVQKRVQISNTKRPGAVIFCSFFHETAGYLYR